MMSESETGLVCLCIDAATESSAAVESWRRQRRSLERLPSQLAESLLHRLLHRRLLTPSLLEVFKHSVEEINLRGKSYVDAEWMAYLGAFRYLRVLTLADCQKINNSALWPITGMTCLKEIDLGRCIKLTDAGIQHLLSIPFLEKLCISETGVTADGIILLTSLTDLSTLDLGGLPVTDSALCSLQVLQKLEYLDLWGSEVSNEGAPFFSSFPRLTFLNLAWTRVTNVPNISSLKTLNMSNCSISSIFEGEGYRPPLSKLILSGATLNDVPGAFNYVETGDLSLLDLSNSSLQSLCFLSGMKQLSHLDLSGTLIGDEEIMNITSMGATLKYLNLSKTRVSSSGVEMLAGHVHNLETILLSGTSTDDTAIPYISLMPSLKSINLSVTNVKGLIQQTGPEPSLIPSLDALSSLRELERLDLEETRIKDVALCSLSSFPRLRYLYLRSGFLTDTSLYEVSSIQTLTSLSVRDAVITNAGLEFFKPPRTLRMLDLRGCWLLTEEILLSFRVKHPHIEVRHDLVSIVPAGKKAYSNSSPSRLTVRTQAHRKQDQRSYPSPLKFEKEDFIDQRLKYSREELLAFQFSTAYLSAGNNGGNKPLE